jgi:hypothetical protein
MIDITYSSNPFLPPAEHPVQHHLEELSGKITPHPYYKYLLDQMVDLNMERLSDIRDALIYGDL